MIDIKLLEKKNEDGQFEFLEAYKAALLSRNATSESLDQLLLLNKKRKEVIALAEGEKARQNKVSAEIAQMKRRGEDASSLITEMGALSTQVKELEAQAKSVDDEVYQLSLVLPNKPNSEVPVGKSEADNKEVYKFGSPKNFTFEVKDHIFLGESLEILDFERATKTTGARFTFLKGAAARLERALIQFMMDTHSTEHGYEEMIPPFIVNSNSMLGTGQFPKFKEDVFNLQNTDYYLIPTAEVPVTNYYNAETLREDELPTAFVAYSPCFRSEAGSYGRDTKGLVRQHQFNKVELMIFSHPDKSYEAHESLTSHAENILKKLELPYRKMLLCTGDMGFGSAKTYDLEVWLPGQNTYREISSCSNFEDFQARRANIRFKPSNGGKPQFVHTLNGSGLAVGRTLIAILENYQLEDGSIQVPEVLLPYMNGLSLIKKKA